MAQISRRSIVVSLSLVLTCVGVTANGQSLSNADLVKVLQTGGNVIVMRHASSPREIPDASAANPDNKTPERQLDEVGRTTASTMGKAIRELHIPIGTVLSSPTYRALETLKLAQLPTAKTIKELGDGGQSMAGVDTAQTSWLKQQVMKFPKGSNTVIVTHFPNITAAFPEYSHGLADGEALVFGPSDKGGAALLARVKIESWPNLGK